MQKISQLFETASNVIQSLTDNQKNPLHVGEVMACWTYLSFVNNIIIYEEVGLNTTTDPGVIELYQDALATARSHKKQLTEFMRKEGVRLPTAPEDKPNSDPNAVPIGAGFTDNELANTLLINFVVASDMCAASASQSLRTDVGLMFLKFQTEKLSLAFKAKELMQKKGWLKVPPFYQPPGAPNTKN
ncbi:DUF3231 family protein [Lentibacillus cibarius]|uniref:DUF3231 family protein n=1 Tax=Lentibacillus cibarius TaxID=2583219 RepID=A0A5S3QN18_9BACI|nr:DUF3231 family protein [Lentibacillus cibarius]TMN23352.1 DUF3231 family protein [Lentibacillus cibarius]